MYLSKNMTWNTLYMRLNISHHFLITPPPTLPQIYFTPPTRRTKMQNFTNLFRNLNNRIPVIGMVHISALPGKSTCFLFFFSFTIFYRFTKSRTCFTSVICHSLITCFFYFVLVSILFTGTPTYAGCVQRIIDGACKDAEIYLKNGIVSSF